MNLVIRAVEPEDAEQVVGILNPIIAAGIHTVFDQPFSVQAEREYIEQFPERGVFLAAVAPEAGRIVGFQSMEPFAKYTGAFDHVGVLGTYVAEDYRRKGIARRLFQETFAVARERGYEKIFTFVRTDNPAALQTYLAQGFSIIGTARKQAKLNGRYIDEVLIEKLFI
ncbi:MAG: GNAT family N-acetyltransferase [Acidobacteria bacterium]|nr:GNAT family N-acetyltransferase [Acidobacteriota bacterium]